MRIFFLFQLMFLSVVAFGQTYHYDAILFGDTVGKTSISRKDSAGFEVIHLHSNTKVKIGGMEKKGDLKAYQIKRNGVVVMSIFKNIKDSETIDMKVVLKNDSSYIYSSGKLVNKMGKIHTTSLDLYYREPTNISAVYLDRIGKVMPITKSKPQEYIIKPESGLTNIYRYSANKITELEMKKSIIGTMYLRLKK